MKSIFKFFPAALALVALASCSSDDLAGGGNVVKNVKGTMEVTVEGGEATRAAFYYDGEKDKPFFVVGDGIRAYDESMQKYDLFEFDEAADAFTTETQYVADGAHKYAIFPTDKISYSGWVPGGEAGSMQALVNIPATLDEYNSASQGITVNNKYSAFKAYLPMWGDITSDADSKLKADLNFLSSYLVISLTNASGGQVTKIEITSMKEGTAENADHDGSKIPSGANTFKTWVVNDAKPLAGFFDAEMKTNGQLKKSSQKAFANDYEPKLTININPANLAYNSDIYVPIVPETYDSLQIKVFDGAHAEGQVIAHKNWSGIKDDDATVTANTIVPAKQKPFARAKGKAVKVDYAAEKTLTAAIPFDVSELLGQYASATSDVNLAITLNGDLATQNSEATSRHTITIPSNLKSNITVTFTGANIDASLKPLTIAGGTAGKTVTFNFPDGTSEKSFKGNLVLNTTSAIVLTGAMSTVGSTLTATKTGGLTLGTDAKVFEANTDGATVTINANDIKVVNATIKQLITKVSPVIDNGVKEITTLTLAKGATTVTLDNGVIGTLNYSATDKIDQNVTVTSKGISAIGAHVDANKNGKTITFNSSLTVKPADITAEKFNTEAAAKINTANGNIFTAAQLAAIKGTADKYKLEANITAFTKEWAPITLTKAFDGNKKTITGLNASLFAALSAKVNDLTLANAEIKVIDSHEGVGVLAQTVTKAAEINKVVVTNAYLGQEETIATNNTINLGGLVGIFKPTETAHLQFIDCSVNATIKGYGQMGGFIGSVDGTTAKPNITIKNTAALAAKTSVTFANTFYSSLSQDMMMGKVGNFIGSITNATNPSTIIIGDDADKTYVNSFGSFATNKIDATALRFNKNYTVKDGVKDKGYVGMANNEIGYSVANAVGGDNDNLKLYGTIVADPDEDEEITIEEKYINIYQ